MTYEHTKNTPKPIIISLNFKTYLIILHITVNYKL